MNLFSRAIVNKKFWIVFIYLLVTSLFFRHFLKNAPILIWDAGQYWDLADKLIKNNFNIFTTDFGMRTFVFPLFIGLLKSLAAFFQMNSQIFIYVINLILFHIGNFLIFTRLSQHNLKVANIFLIFSTFNVINLSMTNVVLTENLAAIFVTVIFFLLTKDIFKVDHALLTGLIAALYVYTRPAAMILLICISVYIFFISFKNKSLHIFYFIIGVLIIFSIGLINVYNTEKRLAFFTNQTNGIYDMQVRRGAGIMKYETSIDKTQKSPQLFYLNQKNIIFEKIACEKAFDCFTKYLIKYPVEYMVVNLTHIFNLFDRTYLETYVSQVKSQNFLLQFYNYFIIASAIMLFIHGKLNNLKVVYTAVFLIIGSVLIYVPTIVEPRFSAPIFPLIITLAAFSMKYFVKYVGVEKVRNLTLLFFFIGIFFIISELVRLNLYNGTTPIY